MKVLWGLYSSATIIQNQSGGKAEDVASILASIVPLFVILCLCFIQKELDRWVTSSFNVTIHLTVAIKREALRFKLTEDRQVKRRNEAVQETLNAENGDSSVDSKREEDQDKLSGGTLGNKSEGKADQKSETFKDEEGNDCSLDVEADLPKEVLESLQRTSSETVAQCRGDGKYDDAVTNQYLVQMIEEFQDLEAEGKPGAGLVGSADDSFGAKPPTKSPSEGSRKAKLEKDQVVVEDVSERSGGREGPKVLKD